MSIRQKQYCDICEHEKGIEHKGAEIIKPRGCPAFPQLIWTYYRKGLALYKDHSGKEYLQESYLGKPNRLEFCEDHANKFNSMLKAFAKNDSRLCAVVDEIVKEDEKNWKESQAKIKSAHKKGSKC